MNAPTPRELPDLRAHLLGLWAPGGIYDRVMQAKWMHDRARLPGYDATTRVDEARLARTGRRADISRWDPTTLADAPLWWIAAPMCQLLNAAAVSVPGDATAQDLAPISDPQLVSGFAVLEEPFIGTSAIEGENQITANAVLWGPVVLPPFRDDPLGVKAWRLATYTSVAPESVAEARVGIGGRLWSPMGASDWPLGDRVDERLWPEQDASMLASFTEDRCLLVALWTLLHQAGLATVTVDRGHRQTRRRLERLGAPPHAADVRIVTLRAARHAAAGESDAERREHDHRWIVSGHWRNQPYGPGRGQRRLQWIAPYVKGPEGTELRVPTTVRVWKR